MIGDPEEVAGHRDGHGGAAAEDATPVKAEDVPGATAISRTSQGPPSIQRSANVRRRRLRFGRGTGDGLALAFLAAVVLVSFREPLTAGLVAFQKDTQVFYYPLQLWFAEELKAGRFPLWNPYIFAGYPIFADGEIGLAYPLHLVLLHLLPVAQAFIWLRISSVLIAAGAMYALCRALGLSRLPAMLGALTFSLGSFFLSQQHHENVTRTGAWLPLVLACIEWALHRAGWRRHAFLTAAAVALAMAAVGLHPQVLAMSLIGFATFVVFRVLVSPIGGRGAAARGQGPGVGGLMSRVALMTWVGVYVGGLGLGLAAVQLLPLAEMGAATYRGSLPDYFFATSYALPLQNLVTLVFPYFFRGPDSEYWSLWAKWETALYVGVAPFILGLLGVLLARRREVIYFLGLAVLALWLAFASYAPLDLYEVLWNIPGLSSFRVPGRYTYLFVLAWSVLAAFGLQALAHRVTGHASRSPRHTLSPSLFPLACCLVLAIGGLAAVWTMGNLRASLDADPGSSLTWLQSSYLSLRHHAEGIAPAAVYEGLLYSLDVANSRTSFALIMLSAALIFSAGLAAATRGTTWLWQTALVGATAADLLLFGTGFHRKLPMEELSQTTPAIQFLTQQGPGARGQGPADQAAVPVPDPRPPTPDEWRVFTPGTVPSLEFDRLVPFRLQDIGGYSSLESRRNFAFWTTISSVQNQLADIANVRYMVYPLWGPTLPSYRLVSFDPERPLLMGGLDTLGGSDSFTLAGDVGHRVQIVAALTKALDVPHGDTVAELTVVPRQGPAAVVPLRAGLDVAEWAYDRPDVVGRAQHEKPAEIAFRRPDVFLADGSSYNLYIYYTERDLPERMEVERIDVRYVHPLGGIELYGIGLYNFDSGQTTSLTAQNRTKLRPVYQDDEVRILENAAAFPRAYVVSGARVAPANVSPLSAMLDTPFDPQREVMLECGMRNAECGISERGQSAVRSPHSALSTAQPIEIGTDRVVYRAAAPGGGYFVHVANFFTGWRAWVDGVDTPILLANGLFRAVPVPPGDHTVELRYEPAAVTLGLQITAWAVLIAAATLFGACVAAGLARRRREALAPA